MTLNPSPELRAMNLVHRIAHRYKNGSGKLDDIARSAFSWMQEADRIVAGIATPLATSHEAARQVFRDAARGHGRAGTADLPGGPDMSMDDAADVYATLAALSPQTLPAPGEVEYIDRGKLKQATDDLIVAVRNSWGIGSAEHNLVRDICDLIARAPGVSLATVAAANDEGVAEAIDALKPFADVYLTGSEPDDECAIDASDFPNAGHVRAARAAIRLLSQEGGKE